MFNLADNIKIKSKIFWSMVHPEDIEWMKKEWKKAEREKTPYSGTFRIKLNNGENIVKTYKNICPHKNQKKCKCPFNANYLKDGKIMRMIDGEEKELVNVSMMKKILSNS